MKKLSQLTVEGLKHYVYFLVDPRNSQVFYVGKGCGSRIYAHLSCALSTEEQNNKLELIREIQNSGQKVSHYIVRHGMEENEAFLVESVLINLLTYKDFNSIASITNIAKGHEQLEYGIKTIEDIESFYNCEDFKIEDVKHNLISININKLFSTTDISIYDATRGFWVLDPKKANQADFVISEYKGIIRAIFKMDEKGWQKASESNYLNREMFEGVTYKNRYFFDGTAVTDPSILKLYMNKKIKKKHGQANPIRYFFVR